MTTTRQTRKTAAAKKAPAKKTVAAVPDMQAVVSPTEGMTEPTDQTVANGGPAEVEIDLSDVEIGAEITGDESEAELEEKAAEKVATLVTPPATTRSGKAAEREKAAAELMVVLVAGVKERAHRDRDWDGGGWDVIEDTWTDEQIAAVVQGAGTVLGAIRKMSPHVERYRAEKKARAGAKDTDVDPTVVDDPDTEDALAETEKAEA